VIVVDTNVLTYLVLPGDGTEAARRAFRQDPVWAAPLLWQSELRNVLAGYLRRGELDLAAAADAVEIAAGLVEGAQFQVDTRRVLRLVAASSCSAYDCEFVALAEELSVPLVTSDRRILRDFPDVAIALERFGGT
jgi:predicted nucleic acid-binding protein